MTITPISEMPAGRRGTWVITHDHIDDRNVTAEDYNRAKETMPYRFKLRDGDDELYYEGLSADSSSFAPLDDFGMPNDGCTDIEYYDDDTQTWKPL